jgi:hypothetical protein
MKFWIEYVDGTIKEFEADNKRAAFHYFYMEGDHAYNVGSYDEEGKRIKLQ